MTPVGGYITLHQRCLFYKKEGSQEMVGKWCDSTEDMEADQISERPVVVDQQPANEEQVRALTQHPHFSPIFVRDNPFPQIQFKEIKAEDSKWIESNSIQFNEALTSPQFFPLSLDVVLIFVPDKKVCLLNLKGRKWVDLNDVNAGDLKRIVPCGSNLFFFLSFSKYQNSKLTLFSYENESLVKKQEWNFDFKFAYITPISEKELRIVFFSPESIGIEKLFLDRYNPRNRREKESELSKSKRYIHPTVIQSCGFLAFVKNQKIEWSNSDRLKEGDILIQEIISVGLLLRRRVPTQEDEYYYEKEQRQEPINEEEDYEQRILFFNFGTNQLIHLENFKQIPEKIARCAYLPNQRLVFFYHGSFHEWDSVDGNYIRSVKVSNIEGCASISAIDDRFITFTYLTQDEKIFAVYDYERAAELSKELTEKEKRSAGIFSTENSSLLATFQQQWIPFQKSYPKNARLSIFPMNGRIVLLHEDTFQVIDPPIEKTNFLVRRDLHLFMYLFKGKEYQDKIQTFRANKKKGPEYHFYLAGLVIYLKTENFVRARKFFGKLRKLEPKLVESKQWIQFLRIPQRELVYYEGILNPASSISSLDLQPRKRLYLGEGNFSNVEGIVNKQKARLRSIPSAITATEVKKESEQVKNDQVMRDRLKRLREEHVNIEFEVDATQIHEKFKGTRFERIQWNCPYLGKDSTGKRADLVNLRRVIREFFFSASALQIAGDRIQLVLAQERDQEIDYRVRQTRYYNILPAATAANYRFIGNRRFDEERNKEYKHAKTHGSGSVDGEKRELIFEKIDEPTVRSVRTSVSKRHYSSSVTHQPDSDELTRDDSELPVAEVARKFMDPNKKEYIVQHHQEGYYYECSTDDESSDYVSE